MAQIHALVRFAIILAGIISTRGPAWANASCTCRNNNNSPGIGDIGVTNYYISGGDGGGTCYVNYNPALSQYDNSNSFNNSGGNGTGFFTHSGSHDGHNGEGYYTYHHFGDVFTGITNFNYFLAYVFDSGTVDGTCSNYCYSSTNYCYMCCYICCGNSNIPTHPFAADGVYPLSTVSGD